MFVCVLTNHLTFFCPLSKKQGVRRMCSLFAYKTKHILVVLPAASMRFGGSNLNEGCPYRLRAEYFKMATKEDYVCL